MQDDNYYTTTADDQTSRQALVESLRAFVKGSINREQQATIQKFIDQQAELHRPELAAAYERQLASEAIDAVRNAPIEKLIVMRDTENRRVADDYKMHQLTAPLLLEDGRMVKLALIAEKNSKQDYAELVAITRASVAVPLATFAKLYENAEFTYEVDDAARQQLIRDLLFAIIRRPKLGGYEFELTNQVSSYAGAVGLAKWDEYNFKKYWHGNRKELSLLFAYPGFQTAEMKELASVFPEEDITSLRSRLIKLQGTAANLCQQLIINERLTDLLGPVRPCDERFMYFVDWLANAKGPREAVFENMTVSSTVSDTQVSAEVERQDQGFRLKFSGRPLSMPHEPMRLLGEVWIDPTQPYLGHQKDKDDFFSTSNVEEWTDHLAAIIASQEEALKLPPLWR